MQSAQVAATQSSQSTPDHLESRHIVRRRLHNGLLAKSRLLKMSAGMGLGLANALILGHTSAFAQQDLPSLPPSEGRAPAVTPSSAPTASPAAVPTSPPSSNASPVPFRSPVRPTQTQPPLPQPLPQPLSPALPFNTNEPLKPGDVVAITVLGFAELSGQQQISSTGTVQLPLGGPIFVGGFTPVEARATLIQALLPYVRRP
ncbi:MAG: polysaccharide biosynthesis/export family protein, partial [Cyanobacteria bacterium J06632_3]